MPTALHDLIRTWAATQSIPLTEQDAGGAYTRLWLLEDGYLAGEIRILLVRPDPPSFHLTVMRGSMVLDESWAELKGLGSCLTMALRLLQKRVKTAAPQWHLHLGDLPP
jgi:hypothetical protein